MFTAFWGWILKTKAAKVGVGALSGTGVIAAVLSLINAKDVSVRQYVDLKHENVITQIKTITKGQDRMLKLLEKIDDRIYKLKTNKKQRE